MIEHRARGLAGERVQERADGLRSAGRRRDADDVGSPQRRRGHRVGTPVSSVGWSVGVAVTAAMTARGSMTGTRCVPMAAVATTGVRPVGRRVAFGDRCFAALRGALGLHGDDVVHAIDEEPDRSRRGGDHEEAAGRFVDDVGVQRRPGIHDGDDAAPHVGDPDDRGRRTREAGARFGHEHLLDHRRVDEEGPLRQREADHPWAVVGGGVDPPVVRLVHGIGVGAGRRAGRTGRAGDLVEVGPVVGDRDTRCRVAGGRGAVLGAHRSGAAGSSACGPVAGRGARPVRPVGAGGRRGAVRRRQGSEALAVVAVAVPGDRLGAGRGARSAAEGGPLAPAVVHALAGSAQAEPGHGLLELLAPGGDLLGGRTDLLGGGGGLLAGRGDPFDRCAVGVGHVDEVRRALVDPVGGVVDALHRGVDIGHLRR